MTPSKVISTSHQQMSQTNVHDIRSRSAARRWVRGGNMTSKWHQYGGWPSAKHLTQWRLTCIYEIIILRLRIFLYQAKVFFISMYTSAVQYPVDHNFPSRWMRSQRPPWSWLLDVFFPNLMHVVNNQRYVCIQD